MAPRNRFIVTAGDSFAIRRAAVLEGSERRRVCQIRSDAGKGEYVCPVYSYPTFLIAPVSVAGEMGGSQSGGRRGTI
jgi:hypothetical protein